MQNAFKDLLMKIILIIILTVNFSLIKSQDLKLESFDIQDNYEKDCNLVSDCIDSMGLADDFFKFTFFTKDPYTYEPKRTLSFQMSGDTLTINYFSRPIIKDTIIYNEQKKKYDTAKSINTMTIQLRDYFYSGCKLYTFGFNGFRTIPQFIRYNNSFVPNCPISIINYTIYKADTINIINKNGFKDGRWIEFYDTGEILKIKEYNDGHFVKGTLFSKDGKDSHPCSDYLDVSQTFDK